MVHATCTIGFSYLYSGTSNINCMEVVPHLFYCLRLLFIVELKVWMIDPYHLMRSTIRTHTFMGTRITHQTFSLLPLSPLLWFRAYAAKLYRIRTIFCRFLSYRLCLLHSIDPYDCVINNSYYRYKLDMIITQKQPKTFCGA